MSRPTQFRLRWKGSITGPFPAARIQDMLRSGEISLVHGLEVDGTWITVRDFLRASGYNRPAAGLDPAGDGEAGAPSAPGAEFAGMGEHLPETFRHAAGESLERTVREGYLWCGSTFLFPPIFALPVWIWKSLAETPANPLSALMVFTVLVFTTVAGCLMPVHFVRKVGRSLDQEGLGEIRQSQFHLAVLLAALGMALWLSCFWFLLHPRN
jgi:hypothetical protein